MPSVCCCYSRHIVPPRYKDIKINVNEIFLLSDADYFLKLHLVDDAFFLQFY